MAVFSYKAMNTSRVAVEGTVTADTARQARENLRNMGLSVRELVPHRSLSARRWWPFSVGSVGAASNEQTTSAISELSTLLGAGITLLHSLETVALQHKDPIRMILNLVHDKIKSGSSLADALAEHSTTFDHLTVSMVKVGEATGTLDEVLSQLADFKTRSLQLKDRVVSALAYPVFLSVVMVGVTAFLMTVVLPSLLDNLVSMGRQLPLPTRIVKFVSDFLVGYGWTVLLAGVVVLSGVLLLLQTDRGKWGWHSFVMSLPVIGAMSRKQTLSKIALILSTLLKSGLVFDRAAEITAGAISNPIFRDALLKAKDEVGAGGEMGAAFSNRTVFPPVMVQVIRVGQESGQLEAMLDRLAVDYDRQVETGSARLASLIEPVLILMLALVVGVIMAAVILPILEAGNVV